MIAARLTINGKQQPDFELEAEPAGQDSNDFSGEISVNVVVFNESLIAPPVRPLDDVADEWKAVSERFAQVGVKIDYTIRYGVDPAVGISGLVAFQAAPGVLGTWRLPTGSQNVISTHENPSADYNLFYVDGSIETFAGSNDFASGAAFMPVLLDSVNGPFGNSAFISGSGAQLLTSAHELAHLLVDGFAQNPPLAGDELHHGSSRNLLNDQPQHGRGRTDSKRLDAHQETRIEQTLGIP